MKLKYKFQYNFNCLNYHLRIIFYIFLIVVFISGCKKFVDVGVPTTGLTSSTVYANNSTSAGVLTGIYSNMASYGNFSGDQSSVSFVCGLSADELINYSPSNQFLQECYTNSLTSLNAAPFWNQPYQYIYVANAAIEGLNNSSTVSVPLKNQLIGEAKFIRGFMYFYLTNLLGDVPLVTTTNYQVNNVASRAAQPLVYQQIIADLISARTLLSDSYLAPDNTTTNERVRPNKGAATALLARVYLYYGNLTGNAANYVKADSASTAVISNSANYSLVSNLDSVFLANSTEAIWQLEPVNPGYNTLDASNYILTSGPNSVTPVALSPFLIGAFESGDKRMTDWVGINNFNGVNYYYPFKYKVGYGQPVTEYEMVLRLAEQYLIRAECEANGAGNGPAAAIQDLNIIRNRAGLPNYSGATDKTSLITAILHERQVELFTEWGNRWLDLKRTGTINTVMSVVTPQKGGTWKADWALYPVPQSELTVNPNLKQNPGY
jgi:hypothetical protein